jgi:hypothetical protein
MTSHSRRVGIPNGGNVPVSSCRASQLNPYVAYERDVIRIPSGALQI